MLRPEQPDLTYVKRHLSLAVLFGATLLAGCNDYQQQGARHYVQLPQELIGLMDKKGMHKHDPILIRSYKKEAELEVWKRGRDGKYALLKTYPICRWSGQLGPKIREGDRQAPEGFYHISARQMNPNSSFHLSFDMGFPNTYDRSLGRSGSFLMVHGACSSRGCYSMTDKQIEEIYALVREAHSGGQASVQMQAMPFRMTPQNLAKHRHDRHMPFWKNLKEGADHFEVTRQEPKVAVCGNRYTFNRSSNCGDIDPGIKTAVAAKAAHDERLVAEAVKAGAPAVRVVYADGGQHPSFRSTTFAYAGGAGSEERDGVLPSAVRAETVIANVSRPDALAQGPKEILIGPDGKPANAPAKPVIAEKPAVAPVAIAAASGKPAAPVRAAGAEQPPAEAKAPVDAVALTKVEKPAGEQPLYKRIFSGLPSLGLGGKSEAAEEPTATSVLPTSAPLPPPRVSQGQAPARTKSTPPPLKTSGLPALIRGSSAPVPTGFSAFAPIQY
jgi:murein L,D-transpeptidase YafK